ncbi:glycosyltransferase [Desulfallas thermosapovorans]|uniref:Glycosyltransferase involved in cell wall biosynthesis n=1 Tax=Desulfallas thermosapovorans DSM 6562 TaxID=1121431 RepID=A0A5S4ZV47_9FIRM|nr:glycosyltransferase [Desulfallas thermosapovorans]TYO96591.1 glycosyltransferase involved in cell wall biosynthesis [Desulfallas thermosapovorans DSM 6562]
MRIVLDLQGVQSTGSRNRGIGRYSLSLALAIARLAGEHEIIIALNSQFPETVELVRATFDGLIPQENIRLWHVPGPVQDMNFGNLWQRHAAERLREAFMSSLKPDVLFVSSLFEGLMDDAITSVGVFTNTLPTALTLYDLIPLIYREHYLQKPAVEAWYQRKLDHLRRAHLWLAISESSRQEGIEYLGLPEEWVVNISTAADARFRPIDLPGDKVEAVHKRYGLVRPFVMYTGGIDYRKNIEGLIRAYSRLSVTIRQTYQLAIVCSIQPGDKQALERLAISHGVAADEIVFTGFVPDEDLLALYNLCHAFIFPSLHEGFGLPVLEAMACGVAVIGANTSSLPEVIGKADALFDPFDDDDIAAKLTKVLIDESFRAELKRHGLKQAKMFSWDRSARRALDAMTRLHKACQQVNSKQVYCNMPSRPRLAYISPLPPEKSGIADYSAELLPELARYYDIDVIVNQREVVDPWVKANCQVRSTEWFTVNSYKYDRVLYHFGNSPFHQHMFGLLNQHPGVVVLHDFFLSNIIAHMEELGSNTYEWIKSLYLSHGYHAVCERFQATDKANVILKYPCNFSVLQQAIGVIVHSEFSRCLGVQWYGAEMVQEWHVIPLLRGPAHALSRSIARRALGLEESGFVVCSFGMLGPTKLNHRLLEAWLTTPLAKDKNCRLFFVGENQSGEYGAKMLEAIRKSGCADRISITGFMPVEQYRQYLAAADVAVQLRSFSRGETSAAVLDCMNYNLPTLVNAHGSLAELPGDCVVMLPDDFTNEQLAQALEALWRDPQQRQAIGNRASNHILAHHAPRRIADQYTQAIESFYNSPAVLRQRLIQSIVAIEGAPGEEGSWLNLARAVTEDLPLPQPQKQLLVDISVLVEQDAKSGIQRVVRSVLMELLEHPPAGFRVEPVYAKTEVPYHYARRFTMKFMSCPDDVLIDEPVEFHQGDIFLGLDLASGIVPHHSQFFAKMRDQGGYVYFIIYDILPILYPDFFSTAVRDLHIKWLNTITRQGYGALCISRAVADELAMWLESVQVHRHRPFKIGWFHLGADIDASLPTRGLPDRFDAQLAQLRTLPSVLMVGTVEPRKGHSQALAAFERLWAQGMEANLVIVGKQGWMVEELAGRLQNHPELGKRLFWYQGISDEALLKLYETATGVLIASEGEGFGLPLIEAARHCRPILARDIPVFREVAGDYASYFSADTPEELAEALREWLIALQSGTVPFPEGMPWQTWADSTKQIVELLTDSNHPNWIHHWLPASNSKLTKN